MFKYSDFPITHFHAPSRVFGRMERFNECYRINFGLSKKELMFEMFNYLCDNYGEAYQETDNYFKNERFSMLYCEKDRRAMIIIEEVEIFNDVIKQFKLQDVPIKHSENEIVVLVNSLLQENNFELYTMKLHRKIAQKIAEKIGKHWSQIPYNGDGLKFSYEGVEYEFKV